MGLWESGETQWHLLCWSHFFFLLFSFSVKGKIKSNTSFQCPHTLLIFLVFSSSSSFSTSSSSSFSLSLPPPYDVCMYVWYKCAWMSVCEQAHAGQDWHHSIDQRKFICKAERLWKQATQRDFGRYSSYHLWSVMCDCPVGRRGTDQMTGPDPVAMILEAVLSAVMWYYYLPSSAFNIGQDEHMENYL